MAAIVVSESRWCCGRISKKEGVLRSSTVHTGLYAPFGDIHDGSAELLATQMACAKSYMSLMLIIDASAISASVRVNLLDSSRSTACGAILCCGLFST